MPASYQIETEPAASLLKVRLTGFFSPEDAKSLRKDLLNAIRSLGCSPGEHRSLYDIRDCKIQSQEIVRIFRAMSDAKGIVARRIAVVAGGSLMRMQLPRIVVDRDSCWFDDTPQALNWLRSADEAVARGTDRSRSSESR